MESIKKPKGRLEAKTEGCRVQEQMRDEVLWDIAVTRWNPDKRCVGADYAQFHIPIRSKKTDHEENGDHSGC